MGPGWQPGSGPSHNDGASLWLGQQRWSFVVVGPARLARQPALSPAKFFISERVPVLAPVRPVADESGRPGASSLAETENPPKGAFMTDPKTHTLDVPGAVLTYDVRSNED